MWVMNLKLMNDDADAAVADDDDDDDGGDDDDDAGDDGRGEFVDIHRRSGS